MTNAQQERERLNHQAYEDCVDAKEPSMRDNETYMECYRFWRSVAGERHFDPYYDPHDGYD